MIAMLHLGLKDRFKVLQGEVGHPDAKSSMNSVAWSLVAQTGPA
jgi:hypothetical protein